jgi:hypothetical protein
MKLNNLYHPQLGEEGGLNSCPPQFVCPSLFGPLLISTSPENDFKVTVQMFTLLK